MKPLMILSIVSFLFIAGCGPETVGPNELRTQPLVYGTPTYSIEMYVDVPSWVVDETTWGEICSGDAVFAQAVADLVDLPPDTEDEHTSWSEIKKLFQGCPHDGGGGQSPPDGGGNPGGPPSG